MNGRSFRYLFKKYGRSLGLIERATISQKTRELFRKHGLKLTPKSGEDEGGTVPQDVEAKGKVSLAGREDTIADNIELRRLEPGQKQPEDPEFEKRHPRDASGKFAKKEEEGEEEEKEEGDDRDKLNQEPWPGAFTWENGRGEDVPIKGVVTLDGIRYTVMEGVTKEELLEFHDVNLKVHERGPEIYGQALEKPEVFLLPAVEGEATASAVPNFFRSEEEIGGVGMVLMDTTFIGSQFLEETIFHETLHCQPRKNLTWGGKEYYEGEGGGWENVKVPVIAEEAYNGIICHEYAERHGFPVVIGWDNAVSPIVKAAQANGWDKQKLYDFAREVHKIDGNQYKSMTELLMRGTGVKYETHPDALSEWWPEWTDTLNEFYRTYRQDYSYSPVVRNWPTLQYSDWEDGG